MKRGRSFYFKIQGRNFLFLEFVGMKRGLETGPVEVYKIKK